MNELDVALRDMLIEDNKRLRLAGCQLAEAAMSVISTYDGVHRLSLAVADWAMAVAGEGGRDQKVQP